MKFSAVGFTCTDVYKNLGISYPTGNGVDLLFNLMEQIPELEPSVVTAVGDDGYGKEFIEECGRRKVDTSHITVVPGGRSAVIEMLLNGRDRVHHRAEKGVMIGYQPSGADMDFIRCQDYIHTDLSWRVAGLLPDMRKNGAKIFFDFSKRYQYPEVPEILKHIQYGLCASGALWPDLRGPGAGNVQKAGIWPVPVLANSHGTGYSGHGSRKDGQGGDFRGGLDRGYGPAHCEQ